MTVYDPETARHEVSELSRIAGDIRKKAMVHIAVDTGMTRIGFHPDEAGADAIEEISRASESD
jgi:alanine racemase